MIKLIYKKLKTMGLFLGAGGLVLSLISCSSTDTDNEPDVNLEKISISLDFDANQDSATAVDLVFVYDPNLLKALMKMKASDYFASSDQIKRDYPEMVEVMHWELTPGQVAIEHPVTEKSDYPIAAFLFADYFSPGTHRLRVGSHEEIHVRLKKYDFCIIEQGCGEGLKRDKNYAEEEAAAMHANLKKGQGSLEGGDNEQAPEDPLDKLNESLEAAKSEEGKASFAVNKIESMKNF